MDAAISELEHRLAATDVECARLDAELKAQQARGKIAIEMAQEEVRMLKQKNRELVTRFDMSPEPPLRMAAMPLNEANTSRAADAHTGGMQEASSKATGKRKHSKKAASAPKSVPIHSSISSSSGRRVSMHESVMCEEWQLPMDMAGGEEQVNVKTTKRRKKPKATQSQRASSHASSYAPLPMQSVHCPLPLQPTRSQLRTRLPHEAIANSHDSIMADDQDFEDSVDLTSVPSHPVSYSSASVRSSSPASCSSAAPRSSNAMHEQEHTSGATCYNIGDSIADTALQRQHGFFLS